MADDSADIAPLGFSVDTSSLKIAQTEAQKTAAEFIKMEAAAGKAAESAGRKADALRKAADEAKKASEGSTLAAQQEAIALEKAAQRAEQNAKTKKTEAEAIKQASAAARDHAASVDRMAGGTNVAAAGMSSLAEQTSRASTAITAGINTATAMAASMASGGGAGIAGATASAAASLTRFIPILGSVGGVAIAAAAGVAAVGTALYQGQKFLAGYQDRLDAVDARIRNTLQVSGAAARKLRDDLTAMSQDTGLGFSPSADAFLRMARNRGSIGATSPELLTLTEATQKLGVISGAGAGETASGMLQLSQALASGRLQGDELRSIMEQMPALAKAIADGLGVSVGQLRTMGSEGQLTSDKVFGAILSQVEKIRSEFAAMPETVERANQRLSDSWDRLFANIGKNLNSSQTLQGLSNAANSIVASAADSLDTNPVTQARMSSDSILQSIAEARSKLEIAQKRADAGSSWWEGRAAQSYKDEAVRTLQQRIEELQRQLVARQYEMYRPMVAQDATIKQDASVERGMTVAQDVLQLASAQKEAATRTKTLEDAIAALEGGLTKFTPQEAAKKLATLQSALLSVREAAKQSTDAVTLFRQETDRMSVRTTLYGTDASLYEQAQKLRSEAALKGQNVSPEDAVAAVVARRLEEARQKAAKEASAITDLAAQVAAARRGRESLAVEQARQAKEAELGATAAATPSGQAAIQQAMDAARRRFAEEQRLRDAQSEMAPQARATGDVRRQMEQLQRSIDDLNAMRGANAARQAAIQFEAGLAEDLKTIPASMKAEYERLKRAQFEAQRANSAEQPFTDASQSVDEMRRQIETQAAAFGKSRAEASSLNEQLRLYNQLVRQGVSITPELAARIKQMGDDYGKTDAALQDVNERQQKAISDMDSFRSASRSALGSLFEGDFQSAGLTIVNFFRDKVLDNLNESLFGKAGTLGGGTFGDFFGSIFGGASGATGATPATAVWVKIANGVLGSGLNDNAPTAGPDATLPALKGQIQGGAGAGASASASASEILSAAAGGGRLSIPSRVNTDLDPRLMEILRTTAQRYGYNAELISGFRPGDPRFHGKGMAADIQLYGANGKAIHNYQNAAGFRDYEIFAQRARLTQQELYPQLNDNFRWGGYFGGPKGRYGALDTMHFDIGGRAMAGGSWENGLTAAQRGLFPGAQSFGMDALNQVNTSAVSAAQALDQLGSTASTASQGVDTLGAKAQQTAPAGAAPTASQGVNLAGMTDPNAFGLGDLFSSLTNGLGSLFGQFGSIFSSLFNGLFSGFGGGGGGGFGNIFTSILGFLFNADGNVFQSPSLHRYANRIVDRPTMFAFANGAGIMGEAGPEAIMPLKRGADGKLGVAATPAFAPANANVAGAMQPQNVYAPQVINQVQSTGNRQQDEALAKRMNAEAKAVLDQHMIEFLHRESRNGGMIRTGTFT